MNFEFFPRQVEVVAWLSQYMESHGVETQRRDRSGQTPLHLAARAGHASAVAVLVAHGADVTAKVTSLSPTPTPLIYINGVRQLISVLVA